MEKEQEYELRTKWKCKSR